MIADLPCARRAVVTTAVSLLALLHLVGAPELLPVGVLTTFPPWMERQVRGPSRPFRVGDQVVLSDLRVRVREITADGRPAEADFEFAVPLEDASLLWTRLQAGGALTPWSPPPVGESQVLPSVAQ